MSGYVRIRAKRQSHDKSPAEFYIAIREIVEIEDLGGGDHQPIVRLHILYTTRKHHRTYDILAGERDGAGDDAQWKRTLTAAQLVADIHKVVAGDAQTVVLRECDSEEDGHEPSFPTRWRGTWEPGGKYAQLDVAAHPDDVSKRLLAVQPSQSTSKAVLANTAFWCPLAEPGGD